MCELNFFFIALYEGSVGLVITQSIRLTGTLQLVIRLMAKLEGQMTSVESIFQFTDVTQEANQNGKQIQF